MCRAYGAYAAPVTPTQAFRPGLNCGAPTALKRRPGEACFQGRDTELPENTERKGRARMRLAGALGLVRYA